MNGQYAFHSLHRNARMARDMRMTVKWLIGFLFLVSGLVGLVYEVAWTRLFTSLFGNTTYAVSTVIAAYMGGLALGSFLVGRFIDRKKNMLRIYAVLEFGIGLSAVLVPVFIRALTPLFISLYRQTASLAWILTFVKVFFSFLILLVPTFLAGGTLPVLTRFFIRRVEESGRWIGLLYAVNTLGAALGCFLTGFFFLERFGIQLTLYIAFSVNFLLAAAFWGLGSLRSLAGAEPEKTGMAERGTTGDAAPGSLTLLLFVFGIAGFVSLSYEVLWNRLLVFKLNTTVYSFSLMLTTFLLGIGLGSLLFTGMERLRLVRNHYRTLGFIETAIGLCGLFTIVLFGRFEQLTGRWISATWNAQVLQHFFLAVVIMAVPTVLMGIALPLAGRIYTRHESRVGRSVGSIYAVNTIGSILGSLLTGFLFVKLLGTQKTLILISSAALLAGVLLIAAGEHGAGPRPFFKRRSLYFLAALIACFVVTAGLIPGDLLFQYYNIGEKQVDSRVRILYAEEGVECITTIHQYPDGNRVISTGSINVAGTDFTLRTTQKLQAHIPMLIHPDPQDVLQVGFGSGETSAIVTSYGPRKLDVVEISAEVLSTSARYFRDINRGVVERPEFEAIIMDGANYVKLTRRRYDLILNDSIWPFYSGNSGLYTQEYFEDCRDHLNPHGLMTSWLPIEIPERDLMSILNTFHSVFPYVSLWAAITHENKHALLVGSLEPAEIDYKTFKERFDRYAREDLKEVRLDNPVFFLDAFKMRETGFDRWTGGSPVHTIDKPILEFAPRLQTPGLDQGRSYELIMKNSESVIPLLKNISAVERDTLGFIRNLERARSATNMILAGFYKREKGDEGVWELFQKAAELCPDHPGVLALMNEYSDLAKMNLADLGSYSFSDLKRLGEAFLKNRLFEKALPVLNKALALQPGSTAIRYDLAVLYYMTGRADEALNELNAVLKEKPDDIHLLNMRGILLYSKKMHSQAIDDFTRIIGIDPQYANAYNNRGILFSATGRYEEALKDFGKAVQIQKEYAEVYFNRGIVFQEGWKALRLTQEEGMRKAIAEYTQALAFDSTYLSASTNRGMMYAMLGDYARAIGDFNRVIALSPNLAYAYYNRGLAYQMKGDRRNSLADFTRAARLDKRYEKVLEKAELK